MCTGFAASSSLCVTINVRQFTGWAVLLSENQTCLRCGHTEFVLRLDNKSRMSREVDVRFRESLGVQFPRATRLICAFQNHNDVVRFQNVLVKRLARFGLSLAEEKSSLLRFGRFAERDCREMNESKPGVFDFLGFTHYCGHSRAGRYKLKRKTSKKKFRQKLEAMKDWLRSNLSTPTEQVWQTLNRKLRGHYQYYGVSDNWDYLLSYRDKVIELVSRWISRRSQRSMSKTDFYKQFLPGHPLVRPQRLTNLFAN